MMSTFSESSSTGEGDVSSRGNIMSLGWRKFKTGVHSMFCHTNQGKDSKTCGVKFLTVISALQITLGILSGCLALVGLAAAFSVREQHIKIAFGDIKWHMNRYYQKHIANLTIQVESDQRYLNQRYDAIIREMTSSNCTWPREYPPQPPHPVKEYEIEVYCIPSGAQSGVCDPYDRLNKHHLIIDYLGIPGLVGIMLIITGLVGLRMVNKWDKIEYLQVSHSYTTLNMLVAVAFAPGMLAVGILQMVFSDYWGSTAFRYVVGQATAALAGVILVMSIIICVVSCCCPVKPHGSLYQEFNKVTPELKGRQMKVQQSLPKMESHSMCS